MTPVEVEYACDLKTPQNQRSRTWHAGASKTKALREGIAIRLMGASRARPVLPVTITLSRIAPRALDDDNLRGAFKAIRDGICDYLGLRSDSSPLITWRYEQSSGPSATPDAYVPLVRVRIVSRVR